jgi:excisionase family DNA binding protein
MASFANLPAFRADGDKRRRRRPRELPGPPFQWSHHTRPSLTAAEVGRLLEMPRTTVYLHTREGRIPSVRIGGRIRYAISDIEQISTKGIEFQHQPPEQRRAEPPKKFRTQESHETHSQPNGEEVATPVIFAGVTGNDPSLRAWMQWAFQLGMAPVIVSLSECQQLADLTQGVLFIDTSALQALRAKEMSTWLATLNRNETTGTLRLMLHDSVPSGAFVAQVLRHGPAVFCPKDATAPVFSQMRRIVLNHCRIAKEATSKMG